MIKSAINYMEMSIEDKSKLCRAQEIELQEILDCNDDAVYYIMLAVAINWHLIWFSEIDLNEIEKKTYSKSIIKIGRASPRELMISFGLYSYHSKRNHEDSCQSYFVIPYRFEKMGLKAYIFQLTSKGEEVFKKEFIPIYFNGGFVKRRKSEFRNEINMILNELDYPGEIESHYDYSKRMNMKSFKLE